MRKTNSKIEKVSGMMTAKCGNRNWNPGFAELKKKEKK